MRGSLKNRKKQNQKQKQKSLLFSSAEHILHRMIL